MEYSCKTGPISKLNIKTSCIYLNKNNTFFLSQTVNNGSGNAKVMLEGKCMNWEFFYNFHARCHFFVQLKCQNIFLCHFTCIGGCKYLGSLFFYS